MAEEAVLQRRYPYARELINVVLAAEPEGSSTWIKAKDIIAYIESGNGGDYNKGDNGDSGANKSTRYKE